MFREFKRQYHRVRGVYNRLGTFTLRVEWVEGNLRAEHKTPNDEETVRLVVLMRPFLNPLSPLYFKKQWAVLQEQFREELSSVNVAHIDQIIEIMGQGYLELIVNGERLTAEAIYQTLSEGEYFDESREAQERLHKLAAVPIVGPLLWDQFHAYTLKGVELVSAIFDAILAIEKTKKYCELRGQMPPAINKCIYCLTTTASFKSEEHIFPESLGNDEFVLPKGFVCDKCNNEILSSLDSALLKFEPVAFLQVMFVPHTKGGKLPQADFPDMTVKRVRPRQVIIMAKDEKNHIEEKQSPGDDLFLYTLQGTMNKLDPKLLGRAIYKIALGMVAFLKGHEQACSNKYDAARQFIVHNQDFQNNILICFDFKPHPHLAVTEVNAPKGTGFVIYVYGLPFMINLEDVPVLKIDDEISKAKFVLFPLYGEPS